MFAPLSGEIMFESCVWCMKDAKMECSTKKGTEHHKESTPTKKEYEVTTGLKAHEPLQWGQVQKKIRGCSNAIFNYVSVQLNDKLQLNATKNL